MNKLPQSLRLFCRARLWAVALFFTLVTVGYCAAETLVDDSGQTISFNKPFTRIISLYPAHTENIASMGATGAIIGISSSDDYPPKILDRKKYSYREDPEKFIGARPDLVLIRPMIQRSYPEFVNKLQDAGIKVVSLQPNNVDEMFVYWQKLGQLTGKQQEAQEMISTFSAAIKRFQEEVETIPPDRRPTVYFEAIHTKMKTFAPDSIAALVLQTSGAVNIGEDATQVRQTNIGYFGKEELLSHGAKIDFYVAQVGRMNPVTADIIAQEPGYQAIKAVREGNIFLIEEQLVSRPTMRILEGIEKLMTLFYPSRQQSGN